MKKIIIALAALATLCSCQESMEQLTNRVLDRAAVQFTLLSNNLGPAESPRNFKDGEIEAKGIQWWCSGFFPGSLWYVYEMTGREDIKELALKETHKLDTIYNIKKLHHDVGFQINSSFGNMYRFTNDSFALEMIHRGADHLVGRFNPTVGCIKSWDGFKGGYEYPVIIDNMMNLELLEFASKLFENPEYQDVAVQHARTTAANHYREDYSTYHVLCYDPNTGECLLKCTHQGLADDSSWGRGQAWSLYGYTMMYRETGLEEFLERAENVSDFIVKNLPEDGVSYWDFNCPNIPNTYRDASAACVMASAYVDLVKLTKDAQRAAEYKALAEKILRTLASDEYLAKPGEIGGFLLKHSVGSLPANSEVDVPLTYADYYFLEALYKFRSL